MAKSYPYEAGSRGLIPGPGEDTPPDRDQTKPLPPAEPADEDDEGQGDEDAEDEATRPSVLGHPTVKDAGGFVLAIMLWGWVVLPYLGGGLPQVKAVWAAKFANKSPKGEWLP